MARSWCEPRQPAPPAGGIARRPAARRKSRAGAPMAVRRASRARGDARECHHQAPATMARTATAAATLNTIVLMRRPRARMPVLFRIRSAGRRAPAFCGLPAAFRALACPDPLFLRRPLVTVARSFCPTRRLVTIARAMRSVRRAPSAALARWQGHRRDHGAGQIAGLVRPRSYGRRPSGGQESKPSATMHTRDDAQRHTLPMDGWPK